MGEILEIAKVMVRPTMKLLDMCNSAIGTIYKPRHMRKMADAKAYEIRKISDAIAESDNMPIVYENGDISMSTVDYEDYVRRAELRAKHQLLREQNNIESVVEKAYAELEGASEVTNAPVDEDWTTRFFNIVKEINTEEMQYIWSKILAGEITKPGSFSMRTLETIKNLSQSEAEAFQKIIPFIVIAGNNYLLSSHSEIYEKYGVKFSDILKLDECGLLSATGGLMLTTTITGESKVIAYNNALVMVTDGVPEKTTEIRFGVLPLTSAGKELYRILNCTANKEYFLSFAEHIYKGNSEVTFIIHNVKSIDKMMPNYDEMIVQKFCKEKETIE